MTEPVGADVEYDALLERTRMASTPEACEAWLPESAIDARSGFAGASSARAGELALSVPMRSADRIVRQGGFCVARCWVVCLWGSARFALSSASLSG